MADDFFADQGERPVLPSGAADADGGGTSFTFHGRRRPGNKDKNHQAPNKQPQSPVQVKLSTVAKQYVAELDGEAKAAPADKDKPDDPAKPGHSINIRI